jgi:TolB-like protein
VFALVLAAAAFLEWPRHQDVRQMPTIAILPFAAAAGAPPERELAADARDAIAHTLLRTEYRVQLSDSPGRVSPRTADFVISGDVSDGPEKAVVTVRVEDTAHNVVVYSNRFDIDRAKAGDLPDQIGAQIAGSLGWTASVLMLERNHPSDPAITAELFRTSLDFGTARQVADRAPNSAIAQVVLAFSASYAIPGLPLDQRAEAAAIGRRALARARILAPGFGSTEMTWCLLHSHARMIECENHLRAGLRRDPFSPGLANWLASELKDVGRTNEALQLATNSLAHDPYDPDYTGMALRMGEAAGMHAEADDLYRTAVRGWPDTDTIFWNRVYGILDSGDFALLEKFQKELSSADRVGTLEPALAVIAALKKNDGAGVRKLCPPSAAPGFKTDVCMLALAHIGDKDDAFTLAWRIYPNRIGRTVAEEDRLWLESGRFFDSDILMGPGAAPLRDDPRYLELARRLGALAYWRSGRLPDFCRPPHSEPICRSLTASP